MATERLGIYKCPVCGIVVEVLDEGAGDMICCGETMRRFRENTVDAAKEKHVPVIERTTGGVKVKIGSVPHPMEAKHFIEWIEILADSKAYRQFLRPGQPAEAFFEVQAAEITAREFCNLHGLWKA